MEVEVRLLGGFELRLDGVPLDLGTQQARCVLAVLVVNHGRTLSAEDLARWAWPGEPPSTATQQVSNYIGHFRRGALAPVAELIRLQTCRPGYRAEVGSGILDTERFDHLVKQAKAARDTAEPKAAAALYREALGICRGRALDGLETSYLRDRAEVLEARRCDAALALAELEEAAGRYAEAADVLHDLVADRPNDTALRAAYQRIEAQRGEERIHTTSMVAQRPLPTDTSAFTGRTAEIEDLLTGAADARTGHSPGSSVIYAVYGMAGIGKTALAVHFAHRVAADFPDGQLFIDLHGYTQGLAPRDPKDALAALLHQLGVASSEIPDDLEDRAALYRAHLAGTARLILLDNAVDEAQVLPLLPASEKCLVLITSRTRLAALDDASILSLDELPMPDAIALFQRIAGPDRTTAGGLELIKIVERCSGVPLAVRIVAALFRNRRWTPAMLLERMTTLEGFSDGSRDLSSLFALSYEALDQPCKIMFKLAGRMPGPDIDAVAAAALIAEEEVGAAARRLERLADQNLMIERAPGRYGLHDLVRLYARELTAGDAEADQAQAQLLDYYQEASARANAEWLEKSERSRQWLRDERANLEACLALADTLGDDARIVAFARGLSRIMVVDAPLAREREIQVQALTAARRLGNKRDEAGALARFGGVQRLSGRIDIARQALTDALELYRELDDDDGIHTVLSRLGQVGLSAGDYRYAERYLREAVESEFRLTNPREKTRAIVHLGDVCLVTGRYEEAVGYFRHALDVYRKVGSQIDETNVLTKLAIVRAAIGEYTESLAMTRRAADIAVTTGSRWHEAYALQHMGYNYIDLGFADEAEEAAAAALDLMRDFGDGAIEAGLLGVLAGARRLRGDLVGAETAIRRALDLEARFGAWGNRAYSLNLCAAIPYDGGKYANALVAYEEAERANREHDQIGYMALSVEGIARCLLALGESRGGIERLNEALAIFDRLGARAHVARIRTQLGDLG